MIKLMCFVKRNPNLSREEFHEHWRTTHANLIRNNEAARKYVVRYEQNHRVVRDYDRPDSPDFDGMTVQWFNSFKDFLAMIADPGYQAEIGPDEQILLDYPATTFLITEAEEIIF
jgi:uncharacterized protein (TIGR02118 family)